MKRLVDTYHPETIVSGKRTIRDGSRFNPYCLRDMILVIARFSEWIQHSQQELLNEW